MEDTRERDGYARAMTQVFFCALFFMGGVLITKDTLHDRIKEYSGMIVLGDSRYICEEIPMATEGEGK